MSKISYAIIFVVSLFSSSILFAQNRLILNNDVFLTIDNGAKVVLDNPNPNAISTLGSGGNIVSETEFNEIIWNIGASTGSYNIPYTTTPTVLGGNQTKIPLSVTLTSAGAGVNGFIKFSTYETNTDSNTPFPSMVTNLTTPLTVIDRFWMIDVENYTTNPEANLVFTYDDAANEIAGSNTITESNLQAQRFNSNINDWELLLFGTANATTNIVSGVNVPSTGFYEAWTLVENIIPLPVTGLVFNAEELDRNALLTWSTETEINSSHFEVQHSVDGFNFQSIGEKTASGNSSILNNYSFVHFTPPNGINYYRLKQFDFDGAFSYSPIRSVNFDNSEELISIYPNPTNGLVFLNSKLNYTVVIMDPLGRLLDQAFNPSQIDLSTYSAGTYIFKIRFESGRDMIYKVIKE